MQEVIAATATKRRSILHKNQCLCFLHTWGLNFSRKIDVSDPPLLSLARSMSRYDPICSIRSVVQDPCEVHPPGSFAELLRKIHASGFFTRSMSQDTLQDPWLRVIWIHVSASMSLGPYARSMPPDPLHDPCLRTRYKSHASGSMSPHQFATSCATPW